MPIDTELYGAYDILGYEISEKTYTATCDEDVAEDIEVWERFGPTECARAMQRYSTFHRTYPIRALRLTMRIKRRDGGEEYCRIRGV